jgi:hypothetical protein
MAHVVYPEKENACTNAVKNLPSVLQQCSPNANQNNQTIKSRQTYAKPMHENE